MNPVDTIAAISTAAGTGAISIVRLSGPDAIQIVDSIFRGKNRVSDARSHSLIYGQVMDPQSRKPADEVLVSVMKAPRTYTREDIVEINCHGGLLVSRKVLELVLREGARLATPGEFTKRAVLNGRMDLNQAEAVLDIVTARTERELECGVAQLGGELSARFEELKRELLDLLSCVECGIDFSEDEPDLPDYRESLSRTRELLRALMEGCEEGRLLSRGAMIAIVGRPNVGKSSLLNALAAEERAIVTPIPGTTRDAVREWVNLRGYPLELVDTAGLRKTRGVIENEGQKRAEASILDADLVLMVLDGSRPLTSEDVDIMHRVEEKTVILVVNKVDLTDQDGLLSLRSQLNGHPVVEVSATEGTGLEGLKEEVLQQITLGIGCREERFVLRSARQRAAVSRCSQAVGRAGAALSGGLPLEIVALEVKDAIAYLDVTCSGEITEEVLGRIFSRFCIGK